MIVQLGVDCHHLDPLGGWLTTEQMASRDFIVFDTFKNMGIGVAWNLAGGYQITADGGIGPVLELHANSAKACIEVHASKRDRKAS